MESFIKEKDLIFKPKAMTLEEMKNLIQMKTTVCKIKCNNGRYGIGFFCNIIYDYNILKVLITNSNVLNKDDISLNKRIKFSLDNERYQYEILIDESRKKYINEKYCISIIEIKEEDKLDKIEFLDIDNKIFENNSKDIFQNKQIYLLHYPEGELEYSNGSIKSINEDNYTIQHLCNSNECSSGAPLININNQKVIGFDNEVDTVESYNIGIFLKEPIEKFIEEIKKN